MYLGAFVPIAAVWTVLRWKQIGGCGPWSSPCWPSAPHRSPRARQVYAHLSLGCRAAGDRITACASPLQRSGLFRRGILAAIAFADLQCGDRSPERARRARWIWAVPAASWLVACGAIAIALRDPPGGSLRSSLQRVGSWRVRSRSRSRRRSSGLPCTAAAGRCSVSRYSRSPISVLRRDALVDGPAGDDRRIGRGSRCRRQRRHSASRR